MKREIFLTNLADFLFLYFSCHFQKICPWCAGTERRGGSPGPQLTAAQGAGARRRRGRARLLLREHLSALLSGSGGLLGAVGLVLPRPHPISCLRSGRPEDAHAPRAGAVRGCTKPVEAPKVGWYGNLIPPKRSVAQLDCLLSHCKQTRVNTGCQLPGAPRSRGQLRVAGGWRPAPAPKAGGSETPFCAPRRD